MRASDFFGNWKIQSGNFSFSPLLFGLLSMNPLSIGGHIHQPQMRLVENQKGKCWYLNSGDWIENLSALEFNGSTWDLYYYNKDLIGTTEEETLMEELNLESLISNVTEKESALA